jgi:DNA (cytosine-5)-methyltransferase 1
MRLLDTFCCEGGAGVGYANAGFSVTGVDLNSKFGKRYPFEFHAGDAIEYILRHGHEFDMIHASPPCQGYTVGNAGKETSWPKLIGPVRDALKQVGVPYVIENVKGAKAELIDPVELCGCMFGMSTVDTDGVEIHLHRSRFFESSFEIAPMQHDHSNQEWVAGAYGGARRDKYDARYVRKGGYVPRDKEVVKSLLGVTHDMTWNGLFESIPPVYTEYIGNQFLRSHG